MTEQMYFEKFEEYLKQLKDYGYKDPLSHFFYQFSPIARPDETEFNQKEELIKACEWLLEISPTNDEPENLYWLEGEARIQALIENAKKDQGFVKIHECESFNKIYNTLDEILYDAINKAHREGKGEYWVLDEYPRLQNFEIDKEKEILGFSIVSEDRYDATDKQYLTIYMTFEALNSIHTKEDFITAFIEAYKIASAEEELRINKLREEREKAEEEKRKLVEEQKKQKLRQEVAKDILDELYLVKQQNRELQQKLDLLGGND